MREFIDIDSGGLSTLAQFCVDIGVLWWYWWVMKQSELKIILRKLGWSKAELARRMGYEADTVSRWKEVPKPVELYLDLVSRILGG